MDEIPVLREEQKEFERAHSLVIDDIKSSFNGELVFYASGWKLNDFLHADMSVDYEAWEKAFHTPKFEEGLTPREQYDKDVEMLNKGIYQWNWTEVYLIQPSFGDSYMSATMMFEAFANNFDNDFEYFPRNKIMRYDPIYPLVCLEDILKCTVLWFQKYLDVEINTIRYANEEECEFMGEVIAEQYSWLKERVEDMKASGELPESEEEKHYSTEELHQTFKTGGYVGKVFEV